MHQLEWTVPSLNEQVETSEIFFSVETFDLLSRNLDVRIAPKDGVVEIKSAANNEPLDTDNKLEICVVVKALSATYVLQQPVAPVWMDWNDQDGVLMQVAKLNPEKKYKFAIIIRLKKTDEDQWVSKIASALAIDWNE